MPFVCFSVATWRFANPEPSPSPIVRKAHGKKPRSNPLFPALVLLSAILGACAPEPRVQAASPTSRAQSLSAKELAPRFLKGGGAWESWDYIFGFPAGYFLFARFQISNLGPGSHRGLAVGMIVSPDGRFTLIKNGRKKKQWSQEIDEEGVTIRIAKHTFRLSPAVHQLEMKNSRGRLFVQSRPVAKLFRPSNQPMAGEKKSETVVLAPRLQGQATIQHPKEKAIDLGTGYGTLIYNASEIAEHKLAVSQFQFHTFEGDVQFSFVESTAPTGSQPRRKALLYVWKGGRVVHRSTQFTRRYTGLRKEDKKPRYPIPSGFEISEKSGSVSLTGSTRLRLVQRYDWLDGLDSAIVRFIVKQFSHPVQYLFIGDYRFELDLGDGPELYEGKGVASIQILNRPPANF